MFVIYKMTNFIKFIKIEEYLIKILLFCPGGARFLVTQSCPTLCDPVDSRLPGSSVHGISQARILEWVAISFSRGSSQPRDQTSIMATHSSILAWRLPMDIGAWWAAIHGVTRSRTQLKRLGLRHITIILTETRVSLLHNKSKSFQLR